MKKTVLHQRHVQVNAKMADFQGWQMPFLFTDVQDEYHAVRTAAGLFDVGCLGRIEITGAGAPALLQKTFTRDALKFPEGSAAYGLFCNESGFVLDNSLLFHLPADGRYLLCTNAANTGKILSWLKKHAGRDVRIDDTTMATAQLALQGPRSTHILDKLTDHQMKKMKPKTLRNMPFQDTTIIVSRTGYTGELGYELFAPAAHAERLWNALWEAGRDTGLLACGFGSRDLLRLEMGYHNGSDLDETRTPLEAGLGACIDFKKDFIGREALQKLKEHGVKQKFIGFELFDKGIPKSGNSIYSENREIGVVTSGNHSPHCRKDIGLGYVETRYAKAGQEIEIEVKDREIAAKVVELPFYRKK